MLTVACAVLGRASKSRKDCVFIKHDQMGSTRDPCLVFRDVGYLGHGRHLIEPTVLLIDPVTFHLYVDGFLTPPVHFDDLCVTKSYSFVFSEFHNSCLKKSPLTFVISSPCV